MRVQRLPGERQVRLAERLVLGRVRVYQLGDLGGERLPVVDQLGLADLLADPAADHVQPDDGTVLDADELDEARGLEDLAACRCPRGRTSASVTASAPYFSFACASVSPIEAISGSQ